MTKRSREDKEDSNNNCETKRKKIHTIETHKPIRRRQKEKAPTKD